MVHSYDSWLWAIIGWFWQRQLSFFFFYLKGIWLEDIKNSGIEVYELKLFLLIEIVNEEIFWFVSFCRILIGSFSILVVWLIKTLYLFIQRQFLDNRRIRTSHNKNRILTHQKSNIWAARFFVLSDQTSSKLKGHRGSHRAL